MNQYAYVPTYPSFPRPETSWTHSFQQDQHTYLGLITAHDPLYAYFKWDRRSNYKSNLLNTLGPWEHTTGAFSLYLGALTVVAVILSGSSSGSS